jgi:hypothetical protein
MDLKSALTRREANTVAALRSVLHILDNTGAVPMPISPTVSDVPRRLPSRDEVENLLRREIADLSKAANEYREYGQIDRAETLDAKGCVVALCVSYVSAT